MTAPRPRKLSAILRIARHEVRRALRDGAALALLVGQLGLFGAALLARWPGYAADRDDKRAAAEGLRALWLEQGLRPPHSAGHRGTVAIKPLPPLALLNPGIDAYTGQWARLVTHDQHEPARRPAADRGPGRRFGELSVFFLLTYLTPLVVFVLGAQSLAREHADGTLALLLAQGVRPQQLLVGKALGLAALLAPQAALLPALAVLLPLGSPEFAGDPAHRLLFLSVAAAVYLAGLVFASLAASGLAPSAGAATVALVGAWLAGAVVLPRAVSSATQAAVRTPSSFDFTRAKDRALGDRYVLGYGGAAAFEEVFTRVTQSLLREYGVAKAADLPVSAFGHALEETERMGQRAYDRSFGVVSAAFERQASWQRASAWLSPILAFRFLGDGVSETDHAAHLRFVRQSEAYRREIMRTLNMEAAARPDPTYDIKTRKREKEDLRGRELWERVPPFRPASSSTHALAIAHLPEAAALVAWALAAALAAAAGARRICARR